MNARAKTSSGPKGDLERTGSHNESHPVAYAIVSGLAVGLLLLVIGLLSVDTYFNAIGPISLAGAVMVAFFVWRRERQTSFFQPHGPFESGGEHMDACNHRPKDVWTPESKHLFPFGPGGVGQMTAHPVGLVIIVGLLFMGLVANPELRFLVLTSAAGGAVIGLVLWFRHR